MPATTSTQPSRPGTLRAILPIASVVVVAGAAMVLRPWLIDAAWPGTAAQRGSIAYHAALQASGLLLAALTLLVAYRLSRGRVATYWGLGIPSAPARPVRWLGVREGTSWRRLGLVMLVWITLLLAGFLYLGLAHDIDRDLSPTILMVALAFAVTNAVAEEVIFRLSLVGVLRGVASDATILALGAAIFGVAHIAGVPGGPVGVVMAVFLGWFLTKSIVETGGMFWAVLIHLVQDILIFAFVLHL